MVPQAVRITVEGEKVHAPYEKVLTVPGILMLHVVLQSFFIAAH